MITAEDYGDIMRSQIAKICARPECRVLVAYGEADVYLGFVAGESDERVVYYCFVKEVYRRCGVARALFERLGIDPLIRFAYPASTRILTDRDTRLATKIPRAVHDPAVARYPKSQRHRSYV